MVRRELDHVHDYLPKHRQHFLSAVQKKYARLVVSRALRKNSCSPISNRQRSSTVSHDSLVWARPTFRVLGLGLVFRGKGCIIELALDLRVFGRVECPLRPV